MTSISICCRFILCVVLLSFTVEAGQVVVRKSTDEPFDAFAVRDQVLLEHEWQEALRMQQQIQILQSLPLGCVLVAHPYRYYRCRGQYFRPYDYQGGEVYIQVDPLSNDSHNE